MWTECPHPDSEIRLKINSANMPMCARQCVTCGKNLSPWLPKKDWPANPPPWDDTAWERWWKPQREAAGGRQQELLAQLAAERTAIDGQRQDAIDARAAEWAAENAAWWARYEAHMKSPAWRMRAEKVKRREGGYCQGCGTRDEYGHCHHKDYKRMGDEMLFDLVWLCRPCHQKLHPHRDLM